MISNSETATLPRQGRQAARVAETRARLVSAGAEAFAASGFHGASMADVVRAAGLSQGAAYNHFAGKDALFAAAFEAEEPFAGLIAAVVEPSPRQSDAGDDLGGQLLGAFETLTRDPSRGWFDLLLIDIVEFDGRHWCALYQRHRSGFARVAGRLEASRRLDTVGGAVGGAAVLRGLIAAALGQTLVARLLAAGESRSLEPTRAGSAIDLLLRGALSND